VGHHNYNKRHATCRRLTGNSGVWCAVRHAKPADTTVMGGICLRLTGAAPDLI